MTPEERREFNTLKKTVEALKTVTDVPFIEELKRRVIPPGIRAGAPDDPDDLTETVRNSADTGSATVAKDPDNKLPLYDTKGVLIGFVGIYNP